jgi:hypothetical protein
LHCRSHVAGFLLASPDNWTVSSVRGPEGSEHSESPLTQGGRAGSGQQADSSHWWTNPTITIPSLLAVVGIIVSLYFALYPRSPQTVNHLAACEQSHPHSTGTAIGLSQIGGVTRFQGCLWPAITGTDSSGFWTVGVQDYPIAGTAAANQFNYVAVFTTACQALSLDYQFNDQLTVAHSRFTVETSQTVSGYNGSPVNLLTGGSVPVAVVRADGAHLIVLYNSRYVLKHVECATV